MRAPVEKAYEWVDSRGIQSVLLRSTWQAFNSIVEQVPHEDSTNHTKLAQLLVHLRSRGTPDDGDARRTSYDGQIWRDLLLYQPTSHGNWLCPSEEITAVTARAVDIQHDTLENAFLARLVHLPGAPDQCELYALIAMQWGLEDDFDAWVLSMNVPGAAMWILYAGECLWLSERAWNEP